jgi:AbiU2
MSASDGRDYFIERMGLELGEIFDTLSVELTWIHWRWTQYRRLFAESPQRIELLNRTAPFFFRVIQDVLFEDTLLAISRIAGPKQSFGKKNLSIEWLPTLTEGRELHADCVRLVQQAKSACAFAKDWRNRRLAHRDLELSLSRAEPLSGASRTQVEESLATLRTVLNGVQQALCNGVTAYDGSPLTWDAEALLPVLEAGLLRIREREECWNRGEDHPDDTTAASR